MASLVQTDGPAIPLACREGPSLLFLLRAMLAQGEGQTVFVHDGNTKSKSAVRSDRGSSYSARVQGPSRSSLPPMIIRPSLFAGD